MYVGFPVPFLYMLEEKLKSAVVKLLCVVNKKEFFVTLLDFLFSSWKIYLHKIVLSQVEWGYGCTATFSASGCRLCQT